MRDEGVGWRDSFDFDSLLLKVSKDGGIYERSTNLGWHEPHWRTSCHLVSEEELCARRDGRESKGGGRLRKNQVCWRSRERGLQRYTLKRSVSGKGKRRRWEWRPHWTRRERVDDKRDNAHCSWDRRVDEFRIDRNWEGKESVGVGWVVPKTVWRKFYISTGSKSVEGADGGTVSTVCERVQWCSPKDDL